MDASAVLLEPPGRRSTVRRQVLVAQPATLRRDAGTRMESDLRRLADGLLNILEVERARVAGLAGEEVVSLITMARYLIEEAARRLARGELDEAPELLKGASARIRDATTQLLELGSALHPKVLDDLGLLPALAMHFRDFSRENRAIFISPRITVAEASIPVDLKLAIFRVVQAALSNVARHSKASAVAVYLSIFEEELRLRIEDNGVGFDLERWRYRSHGRDGCGLGMIQRWVEASGGRWSFEAVSRHGTRVRAVWQLHTIVAMAIKASESEADLPPAPTPG
jgi:two-component system, NarL family, sensor kinase